MGNIHHIHEVIELLFTSEKDYTVKDLYDELRRKFGKDVRFTTCADNLFPIQEVVPFLLSKNKIRISENIIIPLIPACDH
jgi:probable metal-binding protein